MPLVEQIVLASESPYRKALLASTGLTFATAKPAFDESNVAEPTPQSTALMRARGKAEAVANSIPESLVIGGDQVLALGHQQLGKVRTADAAVERLLLLSGKTHHLLSAFVLVIICDGDLVRVCERIVDVPMIMRPITRGEAVRYVDQHNEWQGVVGCYQYENMGINLFESAAGDQSSIIGLPLLPLLDELRKCGVNPLVDPSGPWNVSLPES